MKEAKWNEESSRYLKAGYGLILRQIWALPLAAR